MESINIVQQIQYMRNKVEEKSQVLNFSKHTFQFLQGAMAEEFLEWSNVLSRIGSPPLPPHRWTEVIPLHGIHFIPCV